MGDEQGTCLEAAFTEQYAGHHRLTWVMPAKKISLGVGEFARENPLLRNLHNLIDKQKGRSMRDRRQYNGRIHQATRS
jgi:hypothetical protein